MKNEKLTQIKPINNLMKIMWIINHLRFTLVGKFLKIIFRKELLCFELTQIYTNIVI